MQLSTLKVGEFVEHRWREVDPWDLGVVAYADTDHITVATRQNGKFNYPVFSLVDELRPCVVAGRRKAGQEWYLATCHVAVLAIIRGARALGDDVWEQLDQAFEFQVIKEETIIQTINNAMVWGSRELRVEAYGYKQGQAIEARQHLHSTWYPGTVSRISYDPATQVAYVEVALTLPVGVTDWTTAEGLGLDRVVAYALSGWHQADTGLFLRSRKQRYESRVIPVQKATLPITVEMNVKPTLKTFSSRAEIEMLIAEEKWPPLPIESPIHDFPPPFVKGRWCEVFVGERWQHVKVCGIETLMRAGIPTPYIHFLSHDDVWGGSLPSGDPTIRPWYSPMVNQDVYVKSQDEWALAKITFVGDGYAVAQFAPPKENITASLLFPRYGQGWIYPSAMDPNAIVKQFKDAWDDLLVDAKLWPHLTPIVDGRGEPLTPDMLRRAFEAGMPRKDTVTLNQVRAYHGLPPVEDLATHTQPTAQVAGRCYWCNAALGTGGQCHECHKQQPSRV